MDAIIRRLAQELEQPSQQVENVVRLIDEGNTIPFIARYRKELHGSMDDQLLRQLAERLQYLRSLEHRKAEVLAAVEAQGKMNCRLKTALNAAETLAEVEDLYRPYRPKRRTRATIARERGLEPLAELLFSKSGSRIVPEEAAEDYVNPEKGVETIQDALQGANDILAEQISDDATVRKKLRQQYLKSYTVTLDGQEQAADFARDFGGKQEGCRVTVSARQTLEEIFLRYYGGDV